VAQSFDLTLSRTGSRWAVLFVVIGLGGLLGCGGLGGKQQSQGPGVLTPSPASLNFGNVQTGTSQSLNEAVTNTGQSSLTISQFAVTGSGYTASGITAPLTLAAGDSASFSVQFAPSANGSSSGNIAFTTDDGTVNLPLSGTGVPAGTLSATPGSISFGTVVIGNAASQTVTLANTGSDSVTVTAATVTGTGFTDSGLTLPLTLGANQTTTFSVSFAPTVTGSATGNVALTVTGAPELDIPLSGTGEAAGDLTASPTNVNFGTVIVGNTASQTETLQNVGGSNVTVTAASISGTEFSYTGLSVPLTLGPNQSATFTLKFTPASAGAASGTMSLTVNGSPNISIPLSGTGETSATLTANPTSITFTNVQVGTNSTQTETIKNTGGASATITAVTATGTGFTVSGITLPVTLGSGQTVTFNVTFAPQSAGTFSGNVAVSSNAQNPTLNIPLSGTAVTAGDLTASPTSINFGNVLIGDATSQIVTLKNTGGENVNVTAASITGAGMSYSGLSLPLTLTPNQSTTFSVTFEPAAAGAVNGTMSLTVSGSANVSIPLSGTGVTPPTLTANPTSITFTNITVGTTSTQTETVKNTGGSDAHISAVSASGTGFSISGINPPLTLSAGQSVSFTVSFSPTSTGSFTGSVTVSSDAQNPTLTIPLSGSAVGAQGTLSVSSPINVGNVVQGTSGTATGTLTASTATVVVSSVSLTGTNASEFSITGLTYPVTVNVGQPVSFTVTFSPTAAGSASATATFTSNASNSPTSATLTGTGTPQPVHTVQLTWVASETPDITSYNVYRSVYSGTSCGGYSSIGSTSGSVTTFTDNNVSDGTTYCYVTTAVDESGESTYSNVAEAQIPAP